MFQKCGFADASGELEGADYVVIGLPFDSTTSFRSGSRDGPNAIRLASLNFESYERDCDVDLADLNICDLGNMELGSDPAYAWATIKEGIALLPDNVVPVFLGGEHSIAPPIIGGLVQKRHSELGVLVLDAHMDLREEYGCTRFSHACTSRRILEIEGARSYASIGIRSGSKEEHSFAAENGACLFTSREVREMGIDSVLDAALESLSCEQLYISLDLDALDPAYAPAVGNPEPFGLTPWDVKRVIERLATRAVGFDISELTPAYDRGETALMAASLARWFIAVKARGNKGY
ncbi:MAG: agmatinase [Methanosaeta sp. PtaB.Bin018]|jgi:agmatinase|nr:agmatinase [Methanothrix sp.]OPX74259.1 MAG: agmatinase [Methanosaeta sp. PtaB.Bin018]